MNNACKTNTASRWRCTTCGEPVELRLAREHHDQCPGGDRECIVCGAAVAKAGDLCGGCQPAVSLRAVQ